MLRTRSTVQAVAAVKHEDLERCHPELVDQHVDFADMGAVERREVIGVIDVEAVLRDVEHFLVDLRVRAALLHIVATGTHVIEARGDASLRSGAALGERILGERAVDPAVHVRIDEARKGQPVPAIDNRRGVRGFQSLADLRELAVLDCDVHPLHGRALWAHHADVADQEIIFLVWIRHERLHARKPDYAATSVGATRAAANTYGMVRIAVRSL